MNITPTNISAIRSALSLGVSGMVSPLSDRRHDSIENFVRDMVVPNTFAEKLQASAPSQRFVELRPHQITLTEHRVKIGLDVINDPVNPHLRTPEAMLNAPLWHQ